jgi:ubiquitin carboxyl-terminal hydrolase 14
MDGEGNLAASLRNLFKSMGETSEAFPPFALLQILRQVAPQFAEMASGSGGRGYAQQDAEEAYLRLVTALQNSLKGLSAPSADGQNAPSNSNFVDQYLTGRMSIK